MVTIRAGGEEKPEREEVVEPLEEPTPERRKERREEKVPEEEPEKILALETTLTMAGIDLVHALVANSTGC